MAPDDTLLQLANDAAGVGTFDLDLDANVLEINEHLRRLADIESSAVRINPEQVFGTIHADDIVDVREAVDHAIATGSTYDAEYRYVHRDGQTVWVAARGRCLRSSGTPPRLLGAVWDITDTREARERISDALESLTVGYISMDANWNMTYVNTEASRVAQQHVDELVGRNFWEAFPFTVGTSFETAYRSVAATGESVTFDAFYPEPLNAWVDVRAVRENDGVALYFYDITDRRESIAEAERAAKQSALLARVTAELSATLHAETAVGRLAQIVVPDLGTWCVVTLVDDNDIDQNNRLHDVASWHEHESQRDLVTRYAAARLLSATTAMPLMRAIDTNQMVVIDHDATTILKQTLWPGEAQQLIAELAPESLVVAPLVGRGRTVGVLTLACDASRAPLTPEELDIVRDVAARAGLALDSARLYRQQLDLASSLQRSMLTEPPQPDHGEIVARYVPASEAAQVGGDWYDAFMQPNGSTTLVIGDVIGHDAEAAALMGQVRTLLRGTSTLTNAGPAQSLAQVETVMETLMVDTTATVAIVRLEQDEDLRANGQTALRWSCAGHPPPLVLHDSGEVESLVAEDADIPIGIFPGTERTETVSIIDRGATVLLYTDGLVERRTQDLDVGLERLRSVLAANVHLDLAALCDTVLAELLPDRIDDDAALIAVRLHRQDKPRPSEAGPNVVPDTVPDED